MKISCWWFRTGKDDWMEVEIVDGKVGNAVRNRNFPKTCCAAFLCSLNIWWLFITYSCYAVHTCACICASLLINYTSQSPSHSLYMLALFCSVFVRFCWIWNFTENCKYMEILCWIGRRRNEWGEVRWKDIEFMGTVDAICVTYIDSFVIFYILGGLLVTFWGALWRLGSEILNIDPQAFLSDILDDVCA